MKNVFTALAMALSLNAAAQSQESLLTDYFAIKNALVSGNAKDAAQQATQLKAHMPATDNSLRQISGEAAAIAATTDLKKQREVFATLSLHMYTLVKNGKHTNTVYYQYCPMKKAYWLSATEGIQNPYYGSSMLTCGKVTETLK